MKKKITIHQMIWYIILFSIAGLLIETVFGYITTGVLESRKGLILGPFCPIYGVGAATIIFILNKKKDHPIQLMLYGAIVGDIIEYILSYVMEAMYGSRFWDYSYQSLNVNGRICITYTIFWSILTLVLVRYLKPWIDKKIDRIKGKARKIVDISLVTFLIIDGILTVWGILVYQDRVMKQYKGEEITKPRTGIYQIEDIIFSNEIMSNVFPNLRFTDENGNQIWIKTIIEQK